jgi:hypothetical protein
MNHFTNGIFETDSERARNDGMSDIQFLKAWKRENRGRVLEVKSMPSIDAKAE